MEPQLNAATFAPYTGTTFTTSPGGEPLALTLAAVVAAPEQPHAPRPDPFSLVFTGPADRPVGQGVYALDHADLGRLDVFLVPRQPEADGLARYEAVFN